MQFHVCVLYVISCMHTYCHFTQLAETYHTLSFYLITCHFVNCPESTLPHIPHITVVLAPDLFYLFLLLFILILILGVFIFTHSFLTFTFYSVPVQLRHLNFPSWDK